MSLLSSASGKQSSDISRTQKPNVCTRWELNRDPVLVVGGSFPHFKLPFSKLGGMDSFLGRHIRGLCKHTHVDFKRMTLTSFQNGAYAIVEVTIWAHVPFGTTGKHCQKSPNAEAVSARSKMKVNGMVPVNTTVIPPNQRGSFQKS
jgi:hypothetical protein